MTSRRNAPAEAQWTLAWLNILYVISQNNWMLRTLLVEHGTALLSDVNLNPFSVGVFYEEPAFVGQSFVEF